MKLFSALAWLAAMLLPLSGGLSTALAQDQDPEFNFVPATTVQLPVFGVAVDPDGVLQHQQFAPPGGELFLLRARAAIAAMDRDLLKKSPLRKVSLRRLQSAIARQLDNGMPLTDTMLKLAGLQRVQYVFVYPDQKDVVIAGPAEGWVENADGRAIGITTARPVVLLEDLLTALRVFTPDQPHDIWVGCSIGTTAEGMERLKEFQRSIPPRVAQHEREMVAREVLRGVEEALGNAGVSVFGVGPETNMARVMLEADYRMKLIAIGREPPPIEMPVFFDRLRGAPRNNFQRWWFTPNYQCVEITDDRLALHMVGQGVGLGTEEYKTDERGRLIAVQTNPLRAARLYAEAFTREYQEIAAASPVFGQLRNMIDVLIVANFLRREDSFARASLDIGLLLDNDKITIDTHVAPSAARCMANVAWKGNRLVAPSGGVCILASEALKPEYLMQVDLASLTDQAARAAPAANIENWWWD